MNCVDLAYQQAKDKPTRTAIWMPGGKHTVSYSDLFQQASKAQHFLKAQGIRHGDRLLLVDSLGPRLYTMVLAVLGMGASVLLVEPWMPLQRIRQVVESTSPSAFLAGTFGRLWGARVPAIRRIPRWLNVRSAEKASHSTPFLMESVSPSQEAILTFTSGTTGHPKGVVRTHGFLKDQHRVLTRALHSENTTGADVCIFANFTLANLASGRTTLLMPPSWKKKHLYQLDHLPEKLRPATMTCGPAFLKHAMKHVKIPSLQSIHVGGALTDCSLFEAGFSHWPDADWTHVYGSTEAEPVATLDARIAVEKSREAGYIQTLCLGTPVEEIQYEITNEGLWVTGPHVCPRYIGNDEANRRHKRSDAEGNIWHFMGDHIGAAGQDAAMWYQGRSSQKQEEFQLEQRIYTQLNHSNCFVHTTETGQHILVGEVNRKTHIEGVDEISPGKIYRDRRHRARIDRTKSLPGRFR